MDEAQLSVFQSRNELYQLTKGGQYDPSGLILIERNRHERDQLQKFCPWTSSLHMRIFNKFEDAKLWLYSPRSYRLSISGIDVYLEPFSEFNIFSYEDLYFNIECRAEAMKIAFSFSNTYDGHIYSHEHIARATSIEDYEHIATTFEMVL